MPNRGQAFFDLVIPGALAPHMKPWQDHSHDPAPPDGMLADLARHLPGHPALPAMAMLLAADHECRADQYDAAQAQLGLAETRLKLDLPAGAPALQAALGAIALAREEAARHDPGRACAAILTAMRVALQHRAVI